MPIDLDKLQGTWSVTSLEADGEKMPASTFNGATIVLKGKRFTSTGMGATYKGTVEIDETRKPKSFDLLFSAGPEKGNRNPGIYKLDADKWTICLATRGDQRPRKFATSTGSGYALETLKRGDVAGKSTKKRIAPTTAKQLGSAAPGPPTELEGEWAMVSAIMNGVPMPLAMVKWARRITRGNVTTVVAGPQVFLKASFTLSSLKNQSVIDYLNLEGASKGKSQAGIFEMSGDELRICMSAPGKPRPADFSSRAGDGRSFTTWRLVEK